MNKNKLLPIFLSFLKIGTFTFGGGYSMIPLIEREVIQKHGWVEEKELLDILAISQVTPGVIAINSATYIGYRIARFWGAFFATLGVVVPPFASIYIITFILQQFGDISWVQAAFRGLRVGVIVTMAYSVLKLMGHDKINLPYILILCVTFFIATFSGVNLMFIILAALGAGLLYAYLSGRRLKGRPE